MAVLSRYLTPERVVFLRSRSRERAMRELVDRLVRTTPGLERDAVLEGLGGRESFVAVHAHDDYGDITDLLLEEDL
jgi:hypothetical protein